MGRGHGGTRVGVGSGGGGFDFAREAVTHPMIAAWNKQALDNTMASIDANIRDPKMKAEMKQLVQKMHNEMGGLPTGAEGFQVKLQSQKEALKLEHSKAWNGHLGGNTIYLNANHFGRGYKHAEEYALKDMKSGWSVSTNKPAMKTFVHEIGHKYFSSLSLQGQSQVKAVFSQFKSSKSTKGWGTYSKTSHEEFYADAVAKAVLGGSDKWTKALGSIR